MKPGFKKDLQYYKFCLYGFFKNLRFFEPFLFLFFLEKGITFLQIGILITIREVLANIFEIPSGVIADSLGRKKTLISSFIFYILSFIIFFTSNNYVALIGAMAFYAFGDAFRTGTHKAMIFEYLKRNNWDNQRAHYYGHTRSWSQMGSALSSLIAAAIVFFSKNYKAVFLFSTIPYILDLLNLISYPIYLDGNHKKLNFYEFKNKFKTVVKDLLNSFKNKNILKSITNLSIHSGLHKSIKDYLQPIIQTFALSIPLFLAYSDKQRSAILVGILYFILYLITSFASKNAGKLKDNSKSSEKVLNYTMYFGFILTFASGIFYHFSFYVLSIIFYIVISLNENIRNPIGVAHVSSHYKDEILATALSANSQTKSLFAALLAPLIGLIADNYGIGIALSLIALLIIIISPLFFLRKKDSHIVN